MAFKLGREKRNFKHSGNVKLVRTPLEKDIILDGSATATGAVEAILFLRTSSE